MFPPPHPFLSKRHAPFLPRFLPPYVFLIFSPSLHELDTIELNGNDGINCSNYTRFYPTRIRLQIEILATDFQLDLLFVHLFIHFDFGKIRKRFAIFIYLCTFSRIRNERNTIVANNLPKDKYPTVGQVNLRKFFTSANKFLPQARTRIQSVRSPPPRLAKRKLSLTPSRFEIKTGNSFCR